MVLLNDQYGPVEADFQRFYGLELAVALYGPDPLTWRRIRSLVANLPPDSAFGRQGGWSVSEHLLGTTVELLDDVRRIGLIAGRVPVNKLPPPIDVHRPGTRPAPASAPHEETPAPVRRQATPDEIRAVFAAAFPGT